MRCKIGKVAKIMGVTPEVIRHYRRLGLIVPFKNPEANYRCYASEQIGQLLYIQRFSHVGISLSNIHENILRGNVQTHRKMVQQRRNNYVQGIQRLQQKLMSLDHYISVLKMTAYCLYNCIYTQRPGVFFILQKNCLDIKEDANDSIQFNLFQKNADMFFQCALISKEEDDSRKRVCGSGIYEDCTAEVGVSGEFGFSYLPECIVVIYAFEHNDKRSTLTRERIRAFFQREHLIQRGPIFQRLVYHTSEDHKDADLVEMFMTPYIYE